MSLCHSIISINHQSILNEEGHTPTCHCMEVNHCHIVCFHNMNHCSSIFKLVVNNRDSIIYLNETISNIVLLKTKNLPIALFDQLTNSGLEINQ